MIALLVIVVIGLVVWLVALYSQYSELKASALNVKNEYDKLKGSNVQSDAYFKKYYEINQNIASLLTMRLISLFGAKKAASIYWHMLQNAPSRESVPIIRMLYEKAGFPEEWGDYMYMTTTGGWTQEMYDENDEKNRKIVLRTLVTHFENIEDEMKADDERQAKIMKDMPPWYYG